MSTDQPIEKSDSISLCMQADLIPNSGICAELDGQQIALFYLPNESPQLYALGNWDPIGMVGDIDGRLVVASPMYKQHFDLLTGECLEDAAICVPVFSVSLFGDHVMLSL